MKKYMSFIVAICVLLAFSCIGVHAEENEIVLNIEMTVERDDDGVRVHLVDGQGGSVSTWPVVLELDGTQVDTILTDSEGFATFTYTIPDDTQSIACTAKDGQYEIYRFVGCTVQLDQQPTVELTQTEESTTSTAVTETTATKATTTSTTASVVTTTQSTRDETTLTTSVDGDRVAIGVYADSAFLSASQSSIPEYRKNARMWMDKNLYSSLVSVSSASLQLQLELNEQAVKTEYLIAAKNADPLLATYADDTVKGFAVNMSIAYVDDTSCVPLEIEDGMYTIEMPVPACLSSCDKIAVAVCVEDGLSPLIEVKPVNGMLSFTVQRFQTLAIVGMGDSFVSIQSLSQTPWLIVVIVVVGVLLVVFGVLMLVLVSFRRRKVETVEPDEADADMFSFDDVEDVLENSDQEETTIVEVIAPVADDDVRTEEIKVETDDVPDSSEQTEETLRDETHSLDDMLDEVLNDLENMDS